MYTEPRMTRSRARSQGIDKLEDLSRTTVKTRNTSKKGRPAFANVTNVDILNEASQEHGFVKNLSADFSPAKPATEPLTTEEIPDSDTLAQEVTEEPTLQATRTATEQLLGAASDSMREQMEPLLEDDADQEPKLETTNTAHIERLDKQTPAKAVPMASAQYSVEHLTVDMVPDLSFAEDKVEDAKVAVSDSATHEWPQTPEVAHNVSTVTHMLDEAAPGMLAEAGAVTPASATTICETSPASARPSIADTVQQSIQGEGQNQDHTSPELVLHSHLSSAVAPMSVMMMNSMFKRAASETLEDLEDLHMPQQESPMHHDAPAESIADGIADGGTEGEFSVDDHSAQADESSLGGAVAETPVLVATPQHTAAAATPVLTVRSTAVFTPQDSAVAARYEQTTPAGMDAESASATTYEECASATTYEEFRAAVTDDKIAAAVTDDTSAAATIHEESAAAATPVPPTVTKQVHDSKDGDSSSLPSASPTHVPSPLFQAMDAYANAGATPFPAASHIPGTATPALRKPSPQTTGGQADIEPNLASPLPGSFSRFAVCSAPDVSPYSPMLLRQSEDPRSAAKSDAMMLGSPYQATDSEISFDVAPSPRMGSQQVEEPAEQNLEVHDRWQMHASTSNSPISYISGPVANRLGSKIHASPSYDPRSLNQLRKELAHKLAAKAGQEVEPAPAGLDQDESDYDMSPASAAPRATLSPRDGDELCSALESLGIQSTGKGREPLRGLPVPQGTHIRFDDDDGHAVPSPANTQVRLRGVPAPRNTHIRFD